MPSYETILYAVDGAVATVTINRPDARNGMTGQMLGETFDALSRAASDPGLRVLVITGAGRWFCPGADLVRRTAAPADETAEPNPNEWYQVPRLLHTMPAVTVAALNGAAAGAGLGWALGADIRVAASSARFNTAFLDVGVAGDMGVPWSLPRLIGASKARQLSFLCDKIDADEALRIGLVARVWDDAVFRDETAQLVARLAATAPLALATLKSQYNAAESMTYHDYIDLEVERHHRIVSTDNTREAMRAFLEKRAPVFK